MGQLKNSIAIASRGYWSYGNLVTDTITIYNVMKVELELQDGGNDLILVEQSNTLHPQKDKTLVKTEDD